MARIAGKVGRDRRAIRIGVVVMAIALLLAIPTAARADDMIAGNMSGLLLFAGLALIAAILSLVVFTVAVCLLEAYVMERFLEIGYRRCFWYAVLANVVSMGLGLVWYEIGGQAGWKTALVAGQYSQVGLLLLRSFIITLAEETVVVMLLLGKQRDFNKTFKAMAAANASSYVLLGIITFLISLRTVH